MSGTIATLRSPIQTGSPRRWTNEEFDRLMAGGLLREGDRTYLWDGELFTPMAEGPSHINAVENLRDAIGAGLPPAGWVINQGHPVALGEGFLPEPDVAVLHGPRSGYRDRKPSPPDVALLVEVSVSTYPDDSGEFLRKYAEAGIARYWIVNVHARRIEVYTEPDPRARAYRRREDYGLDEAAPLILIGRDGVPSDFGAVAVRDVLQDSLEDA